MNPQGMIYNANGDVVPGAILKAWAAVRRDVGIVELKKKEGMRFATRASTDLMDKLTLACNTHGVLLYPTEGRSKGSTFEHDKGLGTLADVELYLIAQSIEDGSAIQLYGYGQGADTQDKAGGKAGTYAFKQACIQALLAGGSKAPKSHRIADTDDDDSPIPESAQVKRTKPTTDVVKAALTAAETQADYEAARVLLFAANPETQVACKDLAFAARARCMPA